MKALDTNVIIDYLKGISGVVQVIEKFRADGEDFCISVITEIEIFSHPSGTQEDREKFDLWLKEVTVITLDSSLGKIASNLRRQYRLKIADSIIVATAHFMNAELVTRDHGLKDFAHVILMT